MDITEFFSKKRPRETSDDDKDDVPPPKSTDQGADGHLKTKSDSMSKVAKQLVYKSILSYKKDWEKIYPWSTAQIPKKECFVVCAKVLGGHQQQQEVLGL